MKIGNVYDEIEVCSTAGKYRTYLVRLGDVSWDRNRNYVPTIYILVKYNGIIQYDIPPHFLLEPDKDGISDFEKIEKALKQLKDRNKNLL